MTTSTKAPESRARADEASDDALIEAARGGDVRAFEALVLRHEAGVLRLLRLLGVPGTDREDVAQEVFLRVFRHLAGFRRGRPFASWMYRVVVNSAHDYRLRTRRVAFVEAPWSEDTERAADSALGPEGDAARRDLRRSLEAALTLLTERERAVFVLREMEGLATREVARTLGVTAITVRRHLSLAKDRLRRALSRLPP